MPAEDLDEAYHRYLWGESSPRSFARNAKLGTREKRPRNGIVVEMDATFDVSDLVPR